MPTVSANGITLNDETSGEGEPLLLIPYLAADQACYAFQVADYAKEFRCISVDPRGAGLSDKPIVFGRRATRFCVPSWTVGGPWPRVWATFPT
jgi:pimeloyl-ACP methyl ester carboxylesterase